MNKIWEYNEGYKKNINQYSKNDGIMAFIIWGIMCLTYSFLAFLDVNIKMIDELILIRGSIFNLSLILLILVLIKANNQKLSSVGLYGGKWKTSCIMGGALGIIVFMMNCGQYLIQGKSLVPAGKIVVLAFYYLLVAICEELIFRGYIGTRIQGIIKIKWIAISVTGLLFVLMHFPYRMIAYGMSFQDLVTNDIGWIIDLFVIHIIWNFIYSKTNSLYGSIIPHWISNLAYNIVLR